MFKFTAVLFAIVNGSPSDKPSGILTYHQTTFATEQACMKFAATDEGQIAVEIINQMVAAQRGAIVARLACIKAEDNSI